MAKYSSILLLALVSLFFFVPMASQAQKATVTKKESGRTVTPSVTPPRSGIIMRNGQMMQIRGKGYSPVTQERTFPNGASLTPNGLLTTTLGEKIQLQNGDHLDLQGNLTRNPVELQQSATVNGDTAGLGTRFQQAQHLQERLYLLQRKIELLEKKNELLQQTVKGKTDTAALKKLDEEIAGLQRLLEKK